ncbi:unnamed protein product [Ophioblennius macclurei]
MSNLHGCLLLIYNLNDVLLRDDVCNSQYSRNCS